MQKRFMPMLIFTLILFTSSVLSETTVIIDGKGMHTKPKPVHPIVRPRPQPVRPVVVPVLMHQDNNYYTTVETNCDKFIDIINEKDAEILTLTKALNKLKAEADRQMQETLKKKHHEEMEAFNNRKSSVKTTNSISITEKK